MPFTARAKLEQIARQAIADVRKLNPAWPGPTEAEIQKWVDRHYYDGCGEEALVPPKAADHAWGRCPKCHGASTFCTTHRTCIRCSGAPSGFMEETSA